MQLPPLSVIANYPTPNYVNPETRGPSLLIANCVMLSISLVVVGIRFYTRIFISRCFGPDDFFILLALIWIFGVVGMSVSSYIEFGGSRHVWDIVPSTIPRLLRYSLATQIVFGQAVTFVKISMLLLTRKIMGSGSKTLRNIIIFGIVFVACGNISYTLVMIFQCKPISAAWTLSFQPQDCINEQAHLVSASVINVVSDFLVVLIPIPVVLKLNMKSRQRAIVIALFSTGFMVCIVGIVRTIYGAKMTDKNTTDFAWEAFPVYISGAVELYVGLICASIPPTRAFFTRYAPRLLSLSSSSDNSNSSDRSANSGSKGFFSRDLEKGIELSQLSAAARASPTPLGSKRYSSHWGQDGLKNTPVNQIHVAVGIERKVSISSFDTSSDDEAERKIPKVWKGGKGSRGRSVERMESQTNLVGAGKKPAATQ